MAGIGFVLRKLSRQNNLSGVILAYCHSALASSGPWIFTSLTLGAIMMFGEKFTSILELYNFRLIVIYNFSFSLVFSGAFLMIITRYLSDLIYKKKLSRVSSLFFGALIVTLSFEMPVVFWFYIFYVDLPDILAFSAIINFTLINIIWISSVFLTALRTYRVITFSFIAGLGISFMVATSWSRFGSLGIVSGFNVGLVFIVSMLFACILSEYLYKIYRPFRFLRYFIKYWDLALAGLLYNLANWVDKWVMWSVPEAEINSSGFISYPNYDSAMFLAYLSIIPAMAFFLFSIETGFFEKYVTFYRDIQRGATYNRIKNNQLEIIKNILFSAKNFLIVQLSISVTVILVAGHIFEYFGINYLQIGMFRYGVLGSFFQILALFISILFFYFDARKQALIIYLVFFISNFSLTLLFSNMGFSYYGYGYFLSCVLTFLVSSVMIASYLNNLIYHSFISNNQAVQ